MIGRPREFRATNRSKAASDVTIGQVERLVARPRCRAGRRHRPPGDSAAPRSRPAPLKALAWLCTNSRVRLSVWPPGSERRVPAVALEIGGGMEIEDGSAALRSASIPSGSQSAGLFGQPRPGEPICGVGIIRPAARSGATKCPLGVALLISTSCPNWKMAKAPATAISVRKKMMRRNRRAHIAAGR